MAGSQKVAIVTGAGTGVGRAAALNLMKGGFTVVLVGRRKDKLDEVAKEGAASGGKGVPFAGDMRDPAAIKAHWREVMRTWFPKGTDDPDVALLKISVQEAEYWDAPSSAMVHAYGYAKAVLTGNAPRPGDHQKVGF